MPYGKAKNEHSIPDVLYIPKHRLACIKRKLTKFDARIMQIGAHPSFSVFT